MAKRKSKNKGATQLQSSPELIVITKPEAGVQTHGREISAAGADAAPLNRLLSIAGVELNLLFGDSEEALRAEADFSAAGESADADTHGVADVSNFYYIDAPADRQEELAEQLLELDAVEGAYVKPPAELAEYVDDEEDLNQMQPSIEDAPATTPDFTSRQIYLNPAPAGIDARYAWQVPGGRGAGVRIIDLEWGWNFTHEDLRRNQGGVLAGTNSSQNDHGTAVLGEYSGDRNAFGVTGICSDAVASAVAFSMPTAKAIRIAADKLRAGDIMLLEIHRAGPNATGAGQFGYIAVEWWPDDYAAIRYAVGKGVIVVEAAGNGFQDLDAAIYNQRRPGFPASWRNPFNTANPSSGAVLVGAGAPPPGTHGRNHGPDRSRLGFSNYGRRVDCQGWGREVTTTGYGDLQGGSNRNRWYTDTFSGTSSASPIVVGALGCVQGILRHRGAPLLTPNSARRLLRSTGSPQQDAPSRPRTQRIGNRPDLRQMIQSLPSPTRYSGVFRAGTGRHALWVNATWPSFRQKWQQWSADGLRLVDFEITGSGSGRRYSGVFRAGSGGHALWVNATWQSFRQKWQELSGKGLRLIDIEITGSGSNRRYSGVFRAGSGGHALWVNATWQSFRQKWQELSGKGLRLIDIEITGSGSNRRYSGVFRAGSGGYALWVNATWSSFHQKWKELSGKGLRLIDIEITGSGNGRRYTGVYRAGSGGYALWVNANWDSFRAKWQELNGKGLRLIDFEIARSASAPSLLEAESTSDEAIDFLTSDDGMGMTSFDADLPELEESGVDGFGEVHLGEAVDRDDDVADSWGETILESDFRPADDPASDEGGQGDAVLFGEADEQELALDDEAGAFGATVLDDNAASEGQPESDGVGEVVFS